MSFSELIQKRSHEKNSKIVLALDLEAPERRLLLTRSLKILRAVKEYICAVKVNRQLVLPLGLYQGVQTIVREAHRLRIPTIMDAKLNDVGHTNEAITRHYFKVGFDAIIASPFIGWKGGLEPVFNLAREMSRGVLLLTYMSHEGAVEGYGQRVVDVSSGATSYQFEVFAKKAVGWGADGIIVGATHPERIAEIRKLVGDKLAIYSPGVGVQGGEVARSLNAGATYLIVGRSIFSSKNPQSAAKEIRDAANQTAPA
jgi:orotidine-5'-phosphate decarboxylase